MSGSVNTRAIQSLAREIWEGLTTAQQTALRRARKVHGGYMLSMPVNKRTADSLRDKRLADGDDVTPLGALVRAEGIEATAEQAKRRYCRRKHGQ